MSMSDGQEIYTLLNEIYLILDDGDRRLLSQFSLTPPRYYVLVHIGNRPGLSLSELSNLMLCDKSNATRIIRGLEAEGLVYRLPHETDGRSIRLYLSQTGQEVRKKAIEAHASYNQLRFDKADSLEQEELVEELLTLRRRLRDRLDLAFVG
jgi:DNA-binding MarR family transcriptional regulator